MNQSRDASGGVGAAAGLGYQYLAALEDALNWMQAHPDDDFTFESEDHLSEAIDYTIFNHHGERVISVQAKSSVDGPSGTPLGGPDIARILLKLIDHEARRYVLRTNRPLTNAGKNLARSLSSPTTSSNLEILSEYCTPKDIADAKGRGAELSRLKRCRIISEAVDLDELRKRIAEKVQHLRRLRSEGTGQRSSQVLVGHLIAQVLFLSSRRRNRTMSRADLEELLGTTSATLAGAAGIVDWGVPIGPVPTARTVERPETLRRILSTFSGPPLQDVRHVALTGLSGIGKSTLASMYLKHARHYYDRILWVDAHSVGSLRQAAANYLGVTTQKVRTEKVADEFKHTISTTPGTWLIIFDNAPDDRTIAPWLPETGAVDLIATSTNSTGWSQWHRKLIQPLQESEALALVQERLELPLLNPTAEEQARRLCDSLEFWPLAIELACAFLNGSGAGLNMTDAYLNLLKTHIVEDDTLIPAQYKSHPSLLQAILVALETITTGPTQARLSAMALLRTLSYLPPRSTPLELASAVTGNVEFNSGRYEPTTKAGEDPQTQLELDADKAVYYLSKASLTHRTKVPTHPWGDVLRTNEIILDVVRRTHDPEDQEKTLAFLQAALYPRIKSAVEDYLFDGAEHLTACALSTIDFSQHYRVHTREGIALIGNLAAMYAARDVPETALHLFRLELDTINHLQISASIIQAKIHTEIDRQLYSTAAPPEEIRRSIDQALYFLKLCADDPEERAAVHLSTKALYELIHLLADSSPHETAFRAQATFLLGYYPELEDSLVYYQFQNQLKDLGNDDAATLAAIQEELAREVEPGTRLQLMFFQADATALLGRYADAIKAFEKAIAEARARGIGLAAGWTQVLNAWENAALQHLMEASSEPLRNFCCRLEDLTRGHEPSQQEDRTSLELCRIATRILDTPNLHDSVARLNELSASPLVPTHQKSNVDVLQRTLDACHDFARIRTSHHDARIIPVKNFDARMAPPGPIAFALSQEDLDQIDFPALSTGTWVIDSQGTGLLVHLTAPILLWAEQLNTGWMTVEESSSRQSKPPLRQLATTTFAAHGAEIIIGSPHDGPAHRIIDPTKPTFRVLLQ